MRHRNRLAWRLGATVVVIVTVVILLNGLFGSLLSRQYALNASRKAMRFDSASIVSGIETMMQRGRDSGPLDFIEKVSREGATYQDISLISHPSGEICMTGGAHDGEFLGMGDKTCKLCHANDDDPPSRNIAARDEVTIGSDGSRVLRVTTPIINKPGCRAAACHIHADDGDLLGILETDYSLAGFDILMNSLNATLAVGPWWRSSW